MSEAEASGNSGDSKPKNPNLRPWVKGQSGNPLGRPKVPAELRATARKMCPHVLKRMLDILQKGDDRDSIAAGHLIFDRAYGKPPQDIGITVEQELSAALDRLESKLPPDVYTQVLGALVEERQDGAGSDDTADSGEPTS